MERLKELSSEVEEGKPAVGSLTPFQEQELHELSRQYQHGILGSQDHANLGHKALALGSFQGGQIFGQGALGRALPLAWPALPCKFSWTWTEATLA